MRILIDESLPIELAPDLTGHEVSTMRQQRWRGSQNGVLLRTAVDAGFQIIVSADQSLRYQQNLAAVGIAALIIAGARPGIENIRPLVPKILAAIATIRVGEAIEVRRQ